MAWWLWIVLGLGGLAFELSTPGGLFALFLGASALAVGLLVLAGAPLAPWAQWLPVAALAAVSVALLRERLRRRLAGRPARLDTLVGEIAVPVQDLAPRAQGHAELRGSSWQARNVGEVPLRAGQRCRVERLDGLVLEIKEVA